jgi:hypothetical protein
MPFEKHYSKTPDMHNVPEWGTKAWVLAEGRGKLESKANEG